MIQQIFSGMQNLMPTGFNQKLELDDISALYDSVSLKECFDLLQIVFQTERGYGEEEAFQFLLFTRQLVRQKDQIEADLEQIQVYFILYESLAQLLTPEANVSKRISNEVCALLEYLAGKDGKVACNLLYENFGFFLNNGKLDILEVASLHADVTDFKYLINQASMVI